MRKLLIATSVAIALGSGAGAQAGSISFSFDSLSDGTGTPLSLNSGGITASFSAAGDPGGFQVGLPAVFSFTEQTLFTPGTSGQDSEALDITFSEPVTSFSGDFATDGPGPLGLTALIGGLGGTTVGSNSVTGTIPAGYSFPEGVITFSGGAKFDSIILLDSTDPNFALGNFTVTTGIPEPSTWAMLLAGFAGLGFVRYRSSRKSAALPA